MALIPGRGAELTADMALTVAGGLASATVLTLVIVPVVYEILDSAGDWVQQRVLRIVHSEEIPEAPPVPHAALTAPVRGAALRVASLRIRRLTFGSCRRFIAEPLLEG
jgi:hypothetical protein